MKNKSREMKGITLIALVITIILLLILAGVSIATLTGENGILTQASKAKKETEISEAKERAQLDILDWISENKNDTTTLTYEKIREILDTSETKEEYIKELRDESFITKSGYEILFSELDSSIQSGKIQVNGTSPLTLLKSTGKDLVDYKIYGNSVQNGELTPTNPVKIESVGDKTKNLLDNSQLMINYNYSSSNNGVLAKGTGRIATPKINVENIDTISVKYSRNQTVQTAFVSWDKDGNMTERSVSKIGSKATSVTIDVSECYEIALFWWGSDVTLLEGDIYDVMICEGSEILDYEPKGYKIPFTVRGENLFDINGEVINNYGTKISIDGNSVIATAINSGTSIYYNSKIKLRDIPAGTTLKFSVEEMYASNNNTIRISVAYFDTEAKTTTTIKSLNDSGFINVTIPEKTNDNQQLCITVYSNTNGTVKVGDYCVYKNIRLEIVDPITHNIYLKEPLRKIGDYADYIDFENKKVVRKIFSERITEVGSKSSRGNGYLSEITHKPYLEEQSHNPIGFAISDKFTRFTSKYTDLFYNSYYIQTYVTTNGESRVAYTFDIETVDTIEKAQIAMEDGFEVCYVLEEEIPEDITLPNIPTIKGTTILSVDTEIQPSNVEVIYKGE